MSRPFSPRAVIRTIPRPLLRAFCEAHRLPLDPRADDATVPQVVAVARSLPADLYPRFQAALRDVHDMATEEGTLALVTEARFRRLDVPPEFDAMEGPAARALWFLTYHRQAFHAARLVHAADRLSGRSSTTAVGLPDAVPPHALADLTPLRLALTEYYQTRQGRGRHCHIDPLERPPRLLLFVYLDDYAAVHVGFDGTDRLQRRPHRPAFEVVYQFAAPGTLSVFARGRERVRVDLLELFCRHVLGMETLPEVVRRPAFRLDPLLRRDAARAPNADGGPLRARIRRLRVALPDSGQAVTLDAAEDGAWDDIHGMLDRHVPAAEFPRDELRVTAATLTVGYVRDGENRTLEFNVTRRGSTDLTSKADELQTLGERLLRALGVTDA